MKVLLKFVTKSPTVPWFRAKLQNLQYTSNGDTIVFALSQQQITQNCDQMKAKCDIQSTMYTRAKTHISPFSSFDTVECRYNVVQYKILHTSL